MDVEINQSVFTLLPERAVFWKKHEAVICSDLHWGRELFLQKKGMPIPETSFARETVLLEKMFAHTEAKEWWILGDFIHHPEGLEEDFLERMVKWCKERLVQNGGTLNAIRFVPGNHDRQLKKWIDRFPFVFEKDGIIRDSFQFLHEPLAFSKSGYFSWYGHMHPAISPPIMGNYKLPCFWLKKEHAYLPAFSRLAGGYEINPGREDRVFVLTEEQVIQLY